MAITFLSCADLIAKRLKANFTLAAVNAAYATESYTPLAAVPEIVYEELDRNDRENDTNGTPRAFDLAWLRITIRHTASGPRSLGGGLDATTLYQREGFAWIECRAPFTDATARRKSILLAQAVHSIYENARINELWFNRTSLKEMGKDGAWYRTDVVSYFQWTEHK